MITAKDVAVWKSGRDEFPSTFGEIGRGLQRGVLTTGALGAGALGYLGDIVGSEHLNKWGVESMQALLEKTQAPSLRPAFSSLDDAESAMDTIQWIAGGMSEFLPSMIGSIGAGALGQAAFKSYAKKKLMQELSKDVLTSQARKGAALGIGSFSGVQGVGDIYQAAVEHGGGETPSLLPMALGTGAYIASEMIPTMRALGKLGVLKGQGDDILSRVLKTPSELKYAIPMGAVQQGIPESLGEMSQEIIVPLTNRMSGIETPYPTFSQLRDIGILSFLAGGIPGGIGGVYDARRVQEEKARREEVTSPLVSEQIPGASAPIDLTTYTSIEIPETRNWARDRFDIAGIKSAAEMEDLLPFGLPERHRVPFPIVRGGFSLEGEEGGHQLGLFEPLLYDKRGTPLYKQPTLPVKEPITIPERDYNQLDLFQRPALPYYGSDFIGTPDEVIMPPPPGSLYPPNMEAVPKVKPGQPTLIEGVPRPSAQDMLVRRNLFGVPLETFREKGAIITPPSGERTKKEILTSLYGKIKEVDKESKLADELKQLSFDFNDIIKTEVSSKEESQIRKSLPERLTARQVLGMIKSLNNEFTFRKDPNKELLKKRKVLFNLFYDEMVLGRIDIAYSGISMPSLTDGTKPVYVRGKDGKYVAESLVGILQKDKEASATLEFKNEVIEKRAVEDRRKLTEKRKIKVYEEKAPEEFKGKIRTPKDRLVSLKEEEKVLANRMKLEKNEKKLEEMREKSEQLTASIAEQVSLLEKEKRKPTEKELEAERKRKEKRIAKEREEEKKAVKSLDTMKGFKSKYSTFGELLADLKDNKEKKYAELVKKYFNDELVKPPEALKEISEERISEIYNNVSNVHFLQSERVKEEKETKTKEEEVAPVDWRFEAVSGLTFTRVRMSDLLSESNKRTLRKEAEDLKKYYLRKSKNAPEVREFFNTEWVTFLKKTLQNFTSKEKRNNYLAEYSERLKEELKRTGLKSEAVLKGQVSMREKPKGTKDDMISVMDEFYNEKIAAGIEADMNKLVEKITANKAFVNRMRVRMQELRKAKDYNSLKELLNYIRKIKGIKGNVDFKLIDAPPINGKQKFGLITANETLSQIIENNTNKAIENIRHAIREHGSERVQAFLKNSLIEKAAEKTSIKDRKKLRDSFKAISDELGFPDYVPNEIDSPLKQLHNHLIKIVTSIVGDKNIELNILDYIDLAKYPDAMKSIIGNYGLTEKDFENGDMAVIQSKLAGAVTINKLNSSDMRIIVDTAFKVSGDLEGTVRHESFHILQRLGLLSEEDISILSNKFSEGSKSWEENAATAFETFNRAKKDVGMPVSKIFDKVKKFFERLINGIRGLGFRNTDDIFRAMLDGNYARMPLSVEYDLETSDIQYLDDDYEAISNLLLPTDLLVNPTPLDIKKMFNRSPFRLLRGIVDGETGTLYVWDAAWKTHFQMAGKLGVDVYKMKPLYISRKKTEGEAGQYYTIDKVEDIFKLKALVKNIGTLDFQILDDATSDEIEESVKDIMKKYKEGVAEKRAQEPSKLRLEVGLPYWMGLRNNFIRSIVKLAEKSMSLKESKLVDYLRTTVKSKLEAYEAGDKSVNVEHELRVLKPEERREMELSRIFFTIFYREDGVLRIAKASELDNFEWTDKEGKKRISHFNDAQKSAYYGVWRKSRMVVRDRTEKLKEVAFYPYERKSWFPELKIMVEARMGMKKGIKIGRKKLAEEEQVRLDETRKSLRARNYTNVEVSQFSKAYKELIKLHQALNVAEKKLINGAFYFPRERENGRLIVEVMDLGEPKTAEEKAMAAKERRSFLKEKITELESNLRGKTKEEKEVIQKQVDEIKRTLSRKVYSYITPFRFFIKNEEKVAEDKIKELHSVYKDKSRYEVLPPKDVKEIPDIMRAEVSKRASYSLVENAINRISKGDFDEDSINQLRKELILAVDDEFKSMSGPEAHFTRRNKEVDILGYKEVDLHAVLENYLNGAANNLARMEFTSRSFQILNDIQRYGKTPEELRFDKGVIKLPRTYEMVSNYIKDVLKPDTHADRFINYARSLVFFWYMGGNLRMPFVQIFQNFITGMPVLDRYLKNFKDTDSVRKLGSAVTIYGKAMKDLAGHMAGRDTLSKDLVRILDIGRRRGNTHAQFVNQVRLRTIKETGTFKKRFESHWRSVADLLTMPFAKAEEFNRESALVAAYRVMKAKDPNVTDDEILRFGGTLIDEAHYIIGKINMPKIVRRNAILKFLYTFKSFMQNLIESYIEFSFNKQGKFEWRNLDFAAKSLAMMVLFGGMPALPFLDELLDKIEESTKIPYRARMIQAVTHPDSPLFRGILFGIPGIFGMDFSSSIKMDLPLSIEWFKGVYGGLEQKSMEGLRQAGMGDVASSIENFSPTFIQNIIKAHRMLTEGGTSKTGKKLYNYKGEPLRLTTTESVLQSMGIRPVKLGATYFYKQEKMLVEKGFKKEKYEFYERFREARVKKDLKALTELEKERKAFNIKAVKYGKGISPITKESIKRALHSEPSELEMQIPKL